MTEAETREAETGTKTERAWTPSVLRCLPVTDGIHSMAVVVPAALSRGQVVSGFGLIRFLIGPVVFVEMS